VKKGSEITKLENEVIAIYKLSLEMSKDSKLYGNVQGFITIWKCSRIHNYMEMSKDS
jgi:hypothetical protein